MSDVCPDNGPAHRPDPVSRSELLRRASALLPGSFVPEQTFEELLWDSWSVSGLFPVLQVAAGLGATSHVVRVPASSLVPPPATDPPATDVSSPLFFGSFGPYADVATFSLFYPSATFSFVTTGDGARLVSSLASLASVRVQGLALSVRHPALVSLCAESCEVQVPVLDASVSLF